jgi:acyl-CoA thioester hydrolase
MTQLPMYHAKIEPQWIDFNGHLRDAYYGLVASYAIDDLMDFLGLDAGYRARTRCTLYTLELHLHFLHEVKSTDDLRVETEILDFDRKRIHAGCRFLCSRVGDPVAATDMMLLHVHQGDKPASAPFPEEVQEKLAVLQAPEAAREAFAPRSRKIELKRR